MIEIKCNKRQYERIISAASCFLSNGRCLLGKTFRTCPALYNDPNLTCDVCLRRKIKRIS